MMVTMLVDDGGDDDGADGGDDIMLAIVPGVYILGSKTQTISLRKPDTCRSHGRETQAHLTTNTVMDSSFHTETQQTSNSTSDQTKVIFGSYTWGEGI